MPKQSEVPNRDLFGPWLVERGLTGLAVEVGVHQAEYAVRFLANWPGRYIGVDPWRVLPGYADDIEGSGPLKSDLQSQAARDRDYQLSAERLAPYGDRVTLLRVTSADAAAILADGIADFIYIDACHQYASVRQDLALWFPKVKSGGILAGHDYGSPWQNDVVRAVNEFASARALEIWTLRRGGDSSWYFGPHR